MLQQKIAHLLDGDFEYTTHHQWVSIDDIAWPMQLAVIAAEDQQFPEHYGFDFSAIEKAFKHNQKSKRTRGASTISQQTAKISICGMGKAGYVRELKCLQLCCWKPYGQKNAFWKCI